MSPQVLLKENPKVKQVGDTEVFTFNDKFKSKLYRVKIVTIAGPETEKEAQGTREKIDEDRKHQYAFVSSTTLRAMECALSIYLSHRFLSESKPLWFVS